LKGKRLLVAVSGGADSIALLRALSRLKDLWKLEILVGHVHHGVTGSFEQRAFRERAQGFVAGVANELNVDFFACEFEGERPLESEAELREFRHTSLAQMANERNCQAIALAHHREDLLETRILRLIRGVGPQGLEAMRACDGLLFRPLLSVSKRELLEYLADRGYEFLEDPSNDELDALRNWVRRSWLPALEERRPGSLQSLSGSLERLSERKQREIQGLEALGQRESLDRFQLLTLDRSEKRQLLATYMKHLGVKNYSASHIDEVIKRLDSNRKCLTFRVIGCDWCVDAERIVAKPSTR
jgi:tRNA(Ile)-lysidine synthase